MTNPTLYILLACSGSYDDYGEIPIVASLDKDKIEQIKESETEIQANAEVEFHAYRKIIDAVEFSLSDEAYSKFEDEEYEKFIRGVEQFSSEYSVFDHTEYRFEEYWFIIKECSFIGEDNV